MPMFSLPDMPTPMTMLDDMTKRTTAMMPAELASAVNLMAHPVAASAALSAIGAGMAGHAMGVWFGTLSGAAAASQRVFLQFTDAEAPDVDAFRDALRTPALRAKEAATTLITDVEKAVEAPGAEIRKLTPKAKPRPVARTSDEGVGAAETPSESSQPSPEPVSKATHEPVAEMEAEAPGAAEAAEPLRTEAVEAAAEPVASMVEAVAEIAPRKPAAIDRPDLPDDLKSISGIGPKLEQVLNGMGIWTYAQVAAWEPAETAWLDESLGFRGRIERDGWVSQAAALIGKGG